VYTFLGLEQTHWQFINTFAPWLSAVGTLAAVIVSLYLARKRDTPKARLLVYDIMVVTAGDTRPPPHYVQFRVVNEGDRRVRITQIGWRYGLFKKHHCVQLYEDSLSSKLPIELEHGQEAQWLIPMKMPDREWADYFANGFLSHAPWPVWHWTLRGRAFSSLGNVFETRPATGLLATLRKARRATTKT